MIKKFKAYISQQDLCREHQQIMLALSGGVDSVVMTDLFCMSGYSCMVLHCNFGLRGDESDGDESFVRALAANYELPVFVKKFETETYAEDKGISIQMAARELRYAWFSEMAAKHDVEVIATAHNLNDSVETTLLNMSRGTGIRGLTGIPAKNGRYIRPLLFATRSEILDYSRLHQLKFREDSSNSSTKYQRNKVRHDLIPLFEEINPAFIRTMGENIKRFEDAHIMYRERVVQERERLFSDQGTHIEVDLLGLRGLQPLGSWLYELFNEYGFSMDQCLSIEKILDSPSGKQFISPIYRLFKDRDKLLLFKSRDTAFERYYIDSPDSNAELPFAMDIEVMDRDELMEFPEDPAIALIDLDMLSFPLMLRKWQHGDYFFPLGMDQMKKVSDFFIDNKVPVPVKKHTWLLTSGKQIVWIVGLRIDHRFRITDSTVRILKLHFYGQE
jgi:tRNA(Ile)-lysidine synthase